MFDCIKYMEDLFFFFDIIRQGKKLLPKKPQLWGKKPTIA